MSKEKIMAIVLVEQLLKRTNDVAIAKEEALTKLEDLEIEARKVKGSKYVMGDTLTHLRKIKEAVIDYE